MNNNNENKANETPSKKSAKDQKAQPPVSDSPIVSYETSGEGRKLPIVIFNCNALSQPQPMLAGQKYHLTFKTVNADAKLISQICHAHGFHEVHSSNSDYNLMWTGVHPKPHSFKVKIHIYYIFQNVFYIDLLGYATASTSQPFPQKLRIDP